MYVKFIGALVVLVTLFASHASVYFTGRSHESERQSRAAVNVVVENENKTKKIQKSLNEIASAYHDSAITSQKNEATLQSELQRLHLESTTKVISSGNCDLPDNTATRVQLIQQAIDSSGRLPETNTEPYVLKTPIEAEGYCIYAIFEYNRIAEQLTGLIDQTYEIIREPD